MTSFRWQATARIHSGASPCGNKPKAYAVRVTVLPKIFDVRVLLTALALTVAALISMPAYATATLTETATTAYSYCILEDMGTPTECKEYALNTRKSQAQKNAEAAATQTSATGTQRDCAAGTRVKMAVTRGNARALAQDSTLVDALLRSYDAQKFVANECIDNLIKKVNEIRKKLELIANGHYPPLLSALMVMVASIVDGIMEQAIENTVNAVCNASNQIYNYIDSATKNLICIPQTNAINPFNFNINLKPLSCDGWSIDLLNGNVIGSPVEGMNVDVGNLFQQADQVKAIVDQQNAPVVSPTVTQPVINNIINGTSTDGYGNAIDDATKRIQENNGSAVNPAQIIGAP